MYLASGLSHHRVCRRKPYHSATLTERIVRHCNTHHIFCHIFAPLQVMKMDVEGWEYEILRGATNLLSQYKVWYIIAEANRGIIGEEGAYKLLEFLFARGYSVSNVGFKGPWISGRHAQQRSVNWQGVNIFAVHREAYLW